MHASREETADGRWRLRFERTFAHPVEKVWRAVTEPGQLAAWFPTTIDGERAAGAALRFTFPKGEAPPFEGRVIAFEPPALFEFDWGEDVIRLEVQPAGDGARLLLFDTLAERGKAARDAAGWHTCLEALGLALGGRPDGREEMGRWSEFHRHYVEAFGPEGATMGPPGTSS
jgi:uncharacterized protein YndB with AHSA1/START domain